MSPFGYTLDGNDDQHERVVASTVMRGYALSGGEETVAPGGPWRTGVAYPQLPATIRGAEIEPPKWFGSYELRQPGR
jgi:hypothetical protein